MAAGKKYEMISAAKRVAKSMGVSGRRGGWLYRDGKPYCQGWHQLAIRLVRSGRLAEVEYRGEKRKRYCVIVSEAG